MNERMRELLKNAVKCFNENSSPFSHSELTKLQVTSGECQDLSLKIAEIIDFYLAIEDEGEVEHEPTIKSNRKV